MQQVLSRLPRLPRLPVFAGLLAVALLTSGHVGSPDVFFEGQAGPYPLRVILRPPRVIPGRAEINVRVLSPETSVVSGITRVSVQPVVWNAGPEGVPPADTAKAVPGDPSQWSAELWLMRSTSYSVRVEVRGARGTGAILVPVAPVASERLPMPRPLGWILAGLGLFLLAGGLTAIGAAVRESTLPPGEAVDPRRRRRAWLTMLAAAVLLGLVLWGGRAWWRRVDEVYARTLYRPVRFRTEVRSLAHGAAGTERRLILKIDDPDWLGPDSIPLMPDHGKLMHLFLIRAPELDTFAHLHPVPRGRDAFEVALPPALPAGSYSLYADVTHENGFPETWTARVKMPPAGESMAHLSGVPEPSRTLVPDPDDSFRVGAGGSVAAPPGGVSPLGGGYTMTWERSPGAEIAGRDAGLRFRIRGADGQPAEL
ncbi:MAG TPA: hypothetical protein VMM92_07795, partial [Thermoanaerobaculia bacterium]|nr:hypothetical protein [Thermoanaerobaculia bacterium]